MRLLVLLSLVALQSISSAQRPRPCYYPNGGRALDHRPCDGLPTPEDGSRIPHSACCSSDDNVVCLSSNLCINGRGYLYRGGCTDQTWEDPACPSERCTLYSGSGMNILPCNDATNLWCCAEGGEIPCCQNENKTKFLLNPGTVTYVAEGLLTVSLPISSSTTSAESTTSTESTTTTSEPTATAAPQSTSLSTGAAVGVGIGISIPTILAIVFASLWLIERAKRKRLDMHSEPILPPAPFAPAPGHAHSYGGREGGGGLRPASELHNSSVSSELSGGYGVDAIELLGASVKPPGYVGSY
ncbi:hypothetical protein TWF281_007405 [Arthrobotrys megalospora]